MQRKEEKKRKHRTIVYIYSDPPVSNSDTVGDVDTISHSDTASLSDTVSHSDTASKSDTVSYSDTARCTGTGSDAVNQSQEEYTCSSERTGRKQFSSKISPRLLASVYPAEFLKSNIYPDHR